eukprot:gene57958-79400_t
MDCGVRNAPRNPSHRKGRAAMTKHNAKNQRIKRAYFAYLKEACGRNSASVDGVAKALSRFEESTGHRDLGRFHREQAVAFKRTLDKQANARTGERLSRATVHTTLTALRSFFIWLAGQPGYKRLLSYSDADYFNLSEKEVRVAQAVREKPFPTLEQYQSALAAMPSGTDIELRNRALVALALLGAVGAKAGGANMWKATARVTFWGALAMAVTAGIGKLFGVMVEKVSAKPTDEGSGTGPANA